MNDVLKSAALGIAVGAGIIGGLYAGGKLVQGGCMLIDKTKSKFGKGKELTTPLKTAAQ